jgi:hypothetical protein
VRSFDRSCPQPVELAACVVPASKSAKASEVYIVNGDTKEKVIVVKENLTSYLL